jgi:sugar phosphate isomerase/epimerase
VSKADLERFNGRTQLLIGVRGHDISSVTSADLLAVKIKKSHFDAVQLVAYKSIQGIGEKSGQLCRNVVDSVRKPFERENLKISLLGAYFNPLHPDPEAVEEGINRFCEYLAFARQFGCSYVGTETGSLNRDYSFNKENHNEESFKHLLPIIQKLCAEAEKYDAFVAVEAVWSHTIDTPGKMEKLIDLCGSQRLKVILDPVNMLTIQNWHKRNEIIEDAFRLYGNRIIMIHAKDFIIEENCLCSTVIGQGLMDYDHLISLAKIHCPAAPVIIEDQTNDDLMASQRFIIGVNS